MRWRRVALSSVAVVLAAAMPATAQRVEFAGSVTASELAGAGLHPVGDKRYISLSNLLYGASTAHIDVLDLEALTVKRVTTTRAALSAGFGRLDQQLGLTIPPSGELVLYQPARAGLHLISDTEQHWYVEIDNKTRGLERSVSLDVPADAEIALVGTDLAHRAAWFSLLRFKNSRSQPRSHGPHQIVLRRLDLDSLTLRDVVQIALPARPMRSGYEDRVMVHAAGDFSRFAVVEYDEDDFKTTPPAQLFVVDPDMKTSFSVPALDTTYGVAFSADGRHLFLASSQQGTIARVDLASRKIDKRVAGPKLTHNAIISPSGNQLIVLGSSTQYTTFDLPELTNRKRIAHTTELAAAAQQLFGGGMASLDGRFFVMPEALRPGPRVTVGAGPPQRFVVGRLRD